MARRPPKSDFPLGSPCKMCGNALHEWDYAAWSRPIHSTTYRACAACFGHRADSARAFQRLPRNVRANYYPATAHVRNHDRREWLVNNTRIGWYAAAVALATNVSAKRRAVTRYTRYVERNRRVWAVAARLAGAKP